MQNAKITTIKQLEQEAGSGKKIKDLANDNSYNGIFFQKKEANGERFAWLVFPSFSKSKEKFNFEDDNEIYNSIAEDEEYLKAYNEVYGYILGEMKTKTGDQIKEYFNNVDVWKALTCLKRIYSALEKKSKNNILEDNYYKICLFIKENIDEIKKSKWCQGQYEYVVDNKSLLNDLRVYCEVKTEIPSIKDNNSNFSVESVENNVFSQYITSNVGNAGNSCYFYTAISMLMSNPIFRYEIDNAIEDKKNKEYDFTSLLKNFKDSPNKGNFAKLYQYCAKNIMKDNERKLPQCSASEFLILFLSKLEEINKTKPKLFNIHNLTKCFINRCIVPRDEVKDPQKTSFMVEASSNAISEREINDGEFSFGGDGGVVNFGSNGNKEVFNMNHILEAPPIIFSYKSSNYEDTTKEKVGDFLKRDYKKKIGGKNYILVNFAIHQGKNKDQGHYMVCFTKEKNNNICCKTWSDGIMHDNWKESIFKERTEIRQYIREDIYECLLNKENDLLKDKLSKHIAKCSQYKSYKKDNQGEYILESNGNNFVKGEVDVFLKKEEKGIKQYVKENADAIEYTLDEEKKKCKREKEIRDTNKKQDDSKDKNDNKKQADSKKNSDDKKPEDNKDKADNKKQADSKKNSDDKKPEDNKDKADGKKQEDEYGKKNDDGYSKDCDINQLHNKHTTTNEPSMEGEMDIYGMPITNNDNNKNNTTKTHNDRNDKKITRKPIKRSYDLGDNNEEYKDYTPMPPRPRHSWYEYLLFIIIIGIALYIRKEKAIKRWEVKYGLESIRRKIRDK